MFPSYPYIEYTIIQTLCIKKFSTKNVDNFATVFSFPHPNVDKIAQYLAQNETYPQIHIHDISTQM